MSLHVFACLQAPSLPSYFTVLVCVCVCIHKYVHIKHKSYKLIGSSKLQLPPQIFFYRTEVWKLAGPLHDPNALLL